MSASLIRFGGIACLLVCGLANAQKDAGAPKDAGTAPDGIELSVANVLFDGRRLAADIKLRAVRDTMIDLRLYEMSLAWPTRMSTCAGEWISYKTLARSLSAPGRGQEMLLRAGDKFERRVSMDLLLNRPQNECVDVTLQQLDPLEDTLGYQRGATVTFRTTVLTAPASKAP